MNTWQGCLRLDETIEPLHRPCRDQVCALESGHVVWKGTTENAIGNQEMIDALLVMHPNLTHVHKNPDVPPRNRQNRAGYCS